MHLRLHDNLAAKTACRGVAFVWRGRDFAGWDWNSLGSQQLFRLVFVNVHKLSGLNVEVVTADSGRAPCRWSRTHSRRRPNRRCARLGALHRTTDSPSLEDRAATWMQHLA